MIDVNNIKIIVGIWYRSNSAIVIGNYNTIKKIYNNNIYTNEPITDNQKNNLLLWKITSLKQADTFIEEAWKLHFLSLIKIEKEAIIEFSRASHICMNIAAILFENLQLHL